MSSKRGATYEDLLAVPEHKVAEIVGGDLFASPRPRIRHARVGTALVGALYDQFDRGLSGPGGWWILYEPELHLGGDILVPDIAGWRHETIEVLPDDPAFTVAPDWVCEILSPSTFELDHQRKCPAYARNHVTWLWMIEPGERTLNIYRRAGHRWAKTGSHRADDRVRAEPFEAAEIDLSLLWP